MKLSDLIARAVEENPNLNTEEKELLLKFDLDEMTGEIKSLRESLEAATTEKESALKQLEDYLYKDNVCKLAADYKFSDKNYLEYLCRQNKIDCTDEVSFAPFMENLKKNSPKFFSVSVKSGCNLNESRKIDNYGDNGHDLVSMLKQAPELK